MTEWTKLGRLMIRKQYDALICCGNRLTVVDKFYHYNHHYKLHFIVFVSHLVGR